MATEYYNPPKSDPDTDVVIDYGKSESNIEENTFIIYCVQASLAREPRNSQYEFDPALSAPDYVPPVLLQYVDG